MHHSLKSAYCGETIEDITEGLSRDLKSAQGHSNQKEKRPVVFVFTGQGAHYAGMGSDLFKSSPQFRTTITNLQRVCETYGFPLFVEVIADPNTDMESVSAVQLHLSLMALEIALVDFWKSWGIEPDLVVGYSIGEYAALYASGVLSANDVMYLVGKRAQLVEQNCSAGTHSMLSISGTDDEILHLLSEEDLGNCEVSCLNSSGMIVLSSQRKEILQFESLFKERGIKCRLLEVLYAMHSRQMDAIISDFDQIAKGVRFGSPKVKVISTLLGELVTEDGVFGSEYIVRHTREPVKFQQAITIVTSQQLAEKEALWLDIGPNPTCLGLVRANINVPPSNALASLKKADNNWKTVSASLATFYQANTPVRWLEYHRDFVDYLSPIELPKYVFDTRDFWIIYGSGDQGLQPNRSVRSKKSELQSISTCLHHLLKQAEDEREQSATFMSAISQLSLSSIIQGHKLSGITVCPAGVFSDMALTAARYLLTNGELCAQFPSFSVLHMQIDRPVIPSLDAKTVVQVNIRRQKQQGADFLVSFNDHGKPSAPTIAKCIVRIRDNTVYNVERKKLLPSIQLKIATLIKAAEAGHADRLRHQVFYKLFSNLMDYSGIYKGVEEAIVSDDFNEAIAVVRLPRHEGTDQNFTLSLYWIDALTYLAGFLLNGNPNNSNDDVFIGTYMERMEIIAKDFSPNIRYKCYAYIEHSEGSDWYKGHVYIVHGDSILGHLEGAQFRKMPRKGLHYILGKVEPPRSVNDNQSNGTLVRSMEPNVTSSGAIPIQNGTTSNGTNARMSLNSVFLSKLLDETGMMESELAPSTFFSEIGVDSLMSISILAALRNETGVELGASFLMDHPTLEDTQKALRMIDNQHSGPENGEVFVNGQNREMKARPRECNVVLMQGPASSSSRSHLFLIADGAGSAAAYIYLPKLGDDLTVFAIESPWVKDPENFTCPFREAALIYLAAVRAKQPHGPYLLGGWSAGGIFAYEVARMLLEAGEQVIGLIIIDITGPGDFDRTKVSMPTLSVIDHVGMLAGINRSFPDTPQSQQLKKHMLRTVTCFSKLDPIAMAPGRRPDTTFVIWATKSIVPKCTKENNGVSALNLDAWFYPSTHDGRPDGWDLLIGDKLECCMVQGDHFSIMTPPEVSSCAHFSNMVVTTVMLTML